MARTPLLRSLINLAQDFRASRASGIPVDELREIRAGMSRRKFLAGAAVGAAALAMPKRAFAATQPKVVIVGGGIAGLACALKLSDKGYASTVYEASDRLGGRMHSNNGGYWAANQVTEWCGELIDSGHKTIRGLATRFGLPLDDLLAAQPNGSDDTYFLDGQYYPFDQALTDFANMAAALDADVNNAPFPTLYNSYTQAGLQLDHMSVYDWIESRVPGGHRSPFGQLLDVAYITEYGADSQIQSSLNLIYLLGFQPNHGWGIYGVSNEKFHIRGGNELLPAAIAASLGDSVKTGHSLVRLAQTANGRYTCTFQRANGVVDVTADYVVLALPFAVLRDIDTTDAGFDNLKNTAIQQLGRGHNGKLQVQFDSRGWLGKGPWPGKADGSTYADTGYQSSWEASRAQAGTPGVLVLYSGGSVTDAMRTTTPFTFADDPNVVKDAQKGLRQLAPVYPGLSWNNRATQSLPHKSPFLKLAYSYWLTGQYTEFSGYEAATQGGVYFCGEHTSIDFQGFMEGGAETGTATAVALAKVLK